MIKKKPYHLLTLLPLLASCSLNTHEQPKVRQRDGNDYVVASKMSTLNNGKTIIEYLNKPFTLLGTEIRTDGFMNADKFSIEECEVFFAKAKELEVTTLQIPLEWKDIEPKEGEFDFTYLKKILEYADKYGLKLELLWYGTSMCGESHSYSIPEYILADGLTYPKYDADRTGEFWDYYGISWFLDLTNENLLRKESEALTKSMNFIYEYNKETNTFPVVAVQILNEVDNFVRWRIIDKYIVSPITHERMSVEEAWNNVMTPLNRYGLAVKNSKYRCVTTTNFAKSTCGDYIGTPSQVFIDDNNVYDPPSWVKDIFNLEGIDCVGDDCYDASVKNMKGVMNMFGEKLPGNFPHCAENAGDYDNIASLTLAAFSQGAGYCIYDLCTPLTFTKDGENVDQGITVMNKDTHEITNTNHFNNVKEMNRLLKDAGENVVSFNPNDFIAYNAKTRNPLLNTTQTINTTHVKTTFNTTSGALGFGVENDNSFIFGVDKEATIKLENIHITNVQKGRFINDEFVVEEELGSASNINASKGVYLVTFDGFDNVLTSNAWGYIG